MTQTIPAWRIVKFPSNGIEERQKTYSSLEKANNARILARAWFNYEAQQGRKVGWLGMAQALGLPTEKKSKKRKGARGSGAFVHLVQNGRLPKDQQIRDRL